MKPRISNRLISTLSLLILVGMPPALSQDTQTDSQSQSAQINESYTERVKKNEAFQEMTLKDAIRLSLTNNLNIVIQNYNEQNRRQAIVSAHGAYDPRLDFTVGWQSSETPTTNTLTAGGLIPVFESDRFDWDVGYIQPVKYGGLFTLNLNSNRANTNSQFSTLNPNYSANFSVEYRQPLWKGFRDTSQERQIKISNLDLDISDIQFEKMVSDVVRQVQDLYWDLVLAIETYDAERRSMNLAIVAHEDTQKRVEIGIEAPIEITSARSEVATREQTMIQSEVSIVDAENDLKNLLAPDPEAPIWNVRIIATDKPDFQDLTTSLQQAIKEAVQNRPELRELDKRVAKNDVDRKFYERERRPTVDVTFRYGSVGNRGKAFQSLTIDSDGDGIIDGTIRVPDPDSPLNGGQFSAIGRLFEFNFTNYRIAADVSIPLRNRVNDANLANVNIEERRLMSERRQTTQQVAVEVRKAYQQIKIQKERLEASRVSRELSEEQLDGENKRFQAGLSTNFEVLRIQRDLATAVKDELAAQIAYAKSVTALRQAMYTLIQSNDVVIARGN